MKKRENINSSVSSRRKRNPNPQRYLRNRKGTLYNVGTEKKKKQDKEEKKRKFERDYAK